MLMPLARQTRLHEARGSFGHDDLVMRGDVIAVRVRDEGKAFRFPRIEPQVVLGKVNAARILDLDHRANLRGCRGFVMRVWPVPRSLTLPMRTRFITAMRFRLVVVAFVFLAIATAHAADEYRQLVTVNALPTALDSDFQFRKVKQFLLADNLPTQKASKAPKTRGPVRDPSIGFERSYRLYGAVTGLDQHRLYGDYIDVFWRAKRPAEITVRLEYRQEKLRSYTQAREVTYPHAKGSHKTAFAIIGDDFFADGRILAWRCLLIEKGRVVAEERSYLWR
jgi:hypothetical protein